jgi:hypothetical protein
MNLNTRTKWKGVLKKVTLVGLRENEEGGGETERAESTWRIVGILFARAPRQELQLIHIHTYMAMMKVMRIAYSHILHCIALTLLAIIEQSCTWPHIRWFLNKVV